MQPNSSAKRPNFILIFPDQWRGDALSYLGHPVVETPFIDQMAWEGTTFPNATTPAPTCIPARACLANGKGAYSCGRPGYQDGVPWKYKNTMMELLRNGGYQTMTVGKTHFFPLRNHLGFEKLSLYNVSCHLDPGCDDDDYHPWLRDKSNGLLNTDYARESDPNGWVVQPWTHDEKLHANTWTMDESIRLLERRDPMRSFFLQINFQRPHLPLDPPIEYMQRYEQKKLPEVPIGDWSNEFAGPIKSTNQYCGEWPKELLDRTRRAYYAQCSHIDYQIGKLYHYLRKYKLLENTWIVFTSDHGELLGDHRHMRKMNALQGSMSIPFVVRPPNSVNCERGKRRDEIVTLQDIMPSFLNAASFEVPEEVEGLDFIPLVRGEEQPYRDYLHTEHARLTYDAFYFGKDGWQCIRDKDGKYIWETLSGREWFFDLANDPNEMVNAIEAPRLQSKIDVYRQRLITELAKRPQDGLSDGEKLIPGTQLPQTRQELLD